MTKFLVLMTLVFPAALSTPVLAHPGRTDAKGCHVDKKTGKQHCHPQGAVEEAAQAAKRTGETLNEGARKIEKDVKGAVQSCCKHCNKGKACGDSCISANQTCHKPAGCACD